MTALASPVLGRPNALLARTNPVAKLAATFVISLALLPTVDPLTPALVLIAELCCLPLYGLRPRVLLRRTWLLLVAAAGVGLSNALFSSTGAATSAGRRLIDWGPIVVTESGLASGGALAIRVLAIALPGVVAFATTDPTDLADALIQQLHVPWRFALGALAALRMLPLLGAEWRMLGLARRARGVEAGWSPVARVRVFASLVFTLLVGAVRRGVRMAVAMDARGFGSRPVRTYAREQHMRHADWTFLAVTVAVVLAATTASVALGVWDLALT